MTDLLPTDLPSHWYILQERNLSTGKTGHSLRTISQQGRPGGSSLSQDFVQAPAAHVCWLAALVAIEDRCQAHLLALLLTIRVASTRVRVQALRTAMAILRAWPEMCSQLCCATLHDYTAGWASSVRLPYSSASSSVRC